MLGMVHENILLKKKIGVMSLRLLFKVATSVYKHL